MINKGIMFICMLCFSMNCFGQNECDYFSLDTISSQFSAITVPLFQSSIDKFIIEENNEYDYSILFAYERHDTNNALVEINVLNDSIVVEALKPLIGWKKKDLQKSIVEALNNIEMGSTYQYCFNDIKSHMFHLRIFLVKKNGKLIYRYEGVEDKLEMLKTDNLLLYNLIRITKELGGVI